jgi:hypothetical protein
MSEQLEFDFPCTRSAVLRTAEKYVTTDRAAEHGDIEDNFQCIADYWSTHLSYDVTGSDVAVMMVLLGDKSCQRRKLQSGRENTSSGCATPDTAVFNYGCGRGTRRRSGHLPPIYGGRLKMTDNRIAGGQNDDRGYRTCESA